MKTLVITSLLALPAAALVQESQFQPPARRQPAGNVLPLDECRLELHKEGIIMIGASQTGVLEYVEGKVGDEIQAKATVAKIRDAVMQAKLAAAKKRVESDIEIRYAQASNAAAEERYRQALAKRASYSEAELMNLKLEWKKTKLQIEKAEVDREIQAVEQDEIVAELDNYTITSPISGEVAQVIKKTGESVRQGEDIMQVIDTSHILAIGKLPAAELPKVRKGTEVEIYLKVGRNGAAPPFANVFKGKITYIDPSVSRVTQTCDVHAIVVNAKDRNGNYMLKQGMSARMDIRLGTTAPAQAR